MNGYRQERDTMGSLRVPEDALYGAQTQRAVDNFSISKMRLPRSFLRALGLLKSAAASANVRAGVLPVEIGSAISSAAEQVADGRYDAEFVVDVFQTGSGTSTNMNANEVIANLAMRDFAPGVEIHPNDHVNRSQSSNDMIPSAMHVAAAQTVTARLLPSMERLRAQLTAKARQFDDVVKIGRTHLQDAVPMRLGQEFGGYARQVELGMRRITQALEGIYELPIGGTAIGTGINAPPGFAPAVLSFLTTRTGLPFREAGDHFEAQAARDAAAFLSGALKTFAISLTKIANDIRWLGSGPRCGLGELRVPALQPGSSIMPGKVNPVIPESVLMACAQVMGHDATIAWCAASGNLELNVTIPLIAYDLLESIELLAAAADGFAHKCIAGLEADRERIALMVERSLALGTALTPEIGYEAAAELAKIAHQTGRSIREVSREHTQIPDERLAELLDVKRMTGE
jgi:fumarate hydratase class II